jgi:diaminohydroxyphosphoribosylaminopyrimidine deaminase/5-amino-6-(5-phosphoribosylamino)uracil reductase
MVGTDTHYMALALALAERGRGRTSPNPMVGAVVVDSEGVVVGRGAHEFAGGPHAEVHALGEAGTRAAGATLYCTLEPCSHTGRTGPCAPLVADAGVARVVVAIEDPNPLVNGAGLACLRARGVDVTVGVLRDEAARLNQPFLTVLSRGRPFVTLKIALSLDARIAQKPGVRTALTGAAANRLIHAERAEVDAIAVGSGTILADDPLLTPRGAFRQRPLTRVVFDSRLRTPPSATLFSTLGAGPVIIVSTVSAVAAAPEQVHALVDAGARVEAIDGEARLGGGLARLASLGVMSLVLEGGAALHAAAWRARLVDRVELFVTPHVLGPGAVEWLPDPILASGGLVESTARPVGDDVLIEGYVHWPD